MTSKYSIVKFFEFRASTLLLLLIIALIIIREFIGPGWFYSSFPELFVDSLGQLISRTWILSLAATVLALVYLVRQLSRRYPMFQAWLEFSCAMLLSITQIAEA